MEKTVEVEQITKAIETFELMDKCLQLVKEVTSLANESGDIIEIKHTGNMIKICRDYLSKDDRFAKYGMEVVLETRNHRVKKVIEKLSELKERLEK